MSAHTPGPWEVGAEGNGKPGYVYCDNSTGSAVAIVYGQPLAYTVFDRETEKANARLIAAAPDLLFFAKSILRLDQLVGRGDMLAALDLLVRDAKNVVASATGETE